MNTDFESYLQDTLSDIRGAGLLKQERTLTSPQSALISVTGDTSRQDEVINLCANNYLG